MKKIASILLTMITLGAAAQDLSQGLMASYCMNGNGTDAGPNSYDATVHGAVATTNRFGNSNSALYFDGSNDYMEVTDYVVPNSSYSFSFWTQVDASRSHIAFWVQNTSTSNRISGSVNYNHSGYNTIFWDLGGVTPPQRLEDLYKSFSSDWEHYVMVYDAAKDSTYCYLDGQLHMSGALSVNIDASSKELYIGSGQGALYFKGKIDDFRVYNRAISAAEVDLLYNDDDCYIDTDQGDGLMASYCMNCNGNDAGPNGFHATVYGAVGTTDRFNDSCGALYFDGVNDYMLVTDYVVPNTSYSFSFWSQVDQTKSHKAFWVENTSNSNRISGAVHYNHSGYNTIFWDNGGVTPPQRLEDLYKTFTSDWEHYVMVYDAAKDSTYCYLDGQLHMSGALSVNIDASNRKLYIGSGQNALYYKGKLDDFRVYSRALAADEANDLYHATDDCTTASLAKQVPLPKIGIYPNPSKGIFQFEGLPKDLTYRVVNLSGQEILTGSTETVLDMSGQAKGVYVVLVNGFEAKRIVLY